MLPQSGPVYFFFFFFKLFFPLVPTNFEYMSTYDIMKMKIRVIFVCRSLDVILVSFFFIRLYTQSILSILMKHDTNCISCVTLIAVQRVLKKF